MARNDELIRQYMPLVRRIAWRLAQKLGGDVDDFTSAGMIGLLDAARRFDSALGRDFAGFASFRVRGAIIDDFRQFDTLGKYERDARKKNPERVQTSRFHSTRVTDKAVMAKIAWSRAVPLQNQHDAAMTLNKLMQGLSSRTQDIMRMYYLEDKVDTEIAAVYGVTFSRICQIRAEANKKMRDAADRLGLTLDDVR